ncbi:MAG: SDR family oxidoreductase [Anaerolineales bacterium]
MPPTTNSMNGKICLVTGANSGIGKATALGLAAMGATVVMVCRDPDKGQSAQAEIVAAAGNKAVELMLADLSSQASIRQLSNDLKARHLSLHVLINNAAVNLSQRMVTVDGFEIVFAVNHLAPFLLTHLLLETLKASAPARIVNIASRGHSRSMDFDNLQGEKRFRQSEAYSRSKLANILFTYELARRLEGTGVTANCLDPGAVRTNLGRDFQGFFRVMLAVLWPFMISPEEGAQTSLYLAASPEVASVNGKFFFNKKEIQSAPVSYDEAAARRLWQVSAALADLGV